MYKRRIRWVIISMVFLATGLSFLDRQLLSMTIITIQREFKISDVQYGWVNTSFLVSYALMFTIAGRLIDKYGGKIGLAVSVGLWSIASGLHGLINSFGHLITLRFFLGVGEGGAFPGAAKIVSQWFNVKERALANGIAIGGSAIGAVVAPPLTTYLAINFGWRTAFVISGIIGIVWLLIWLLLPGAGKNEVESPSSVQEPVAKQDSLWSILKQKQVIVFIVIRMLLDPVFYFIMFWIPKFLNTAHQMSFESIGKVFWIPFLALGLANILGGWLSDKLIARTGSVNKSRKIVMGIAAALTMVIPLIGYISSTDLIIFLIAVLLFAHGFWITNYITCITDIFGNTSSSTIVGLSGTAGAISGIIINPFLGVVIAGYGYSPIWVLSGLMYPIAFIVLLVFIPKIQALKSLA